MSTQREIRRERIKARGKNILRVLRRGETQRPDGIYVFSYIDRQGKQKHVYSPRLEESDELPEGRRQKPALRTLSAKIMRDLQDEINAQDMDVIELVEDYIVTRCGYVRHSTEVNYRFVLNILKAEDFGRKMIGSIKTSMAKEFLQELQRKGRGFSTIQSIRGVLRPAFRRAVENDWIRKNPFEFPLAGVVINDSVKREAISADQMRKFLKFIKEDKHFSRYYDAINILFKTGIRISEFCGLTLNDFNSENKTITIHRQLHRLSDMTYVIEQTKTSYGERVLPLTDGVVTSFQNLLDNRRKPAKEPTIDGIYGFLCLDKNDMPMVAYHWEKYFQHILEKYNKTFKEEMPKITPHVCRHTYCSNMAKAGINPVYLSYLMGHSDKEITLNVYTTVNADNSMNEIKQAVVSTTKNPYYQSLLN